MIVSVFEVHEINGSVCVEKIPPDILAGTERERKVAAVIDQTVRWALEFVRGDFTTDQLKSHLISKLNDPPPIKPDFSPPSAN